MLRYQLNPHFLFNTLNAISTLILEQETEIGAVQAGFVADMVILEADPLEDIRNTTAIRAVVRGGRLFDRAALDAMLERAKATVGN